MKEGIKLSERRYLVDFDRSTIKKEYHDAIIIGSGIAGVYTALEISPEADIAILTKETLDISNSVLAQGGIAVSLDKKDSPELHLKDTLYAGVGLCDEECVWLLVKEAAENIHRLCDFGVNFDKKELDKVKDITGKNDPKDEKDNEFQELSLTREAAHSMNRIIHAGDTTGKEVCDKLISVVKTRENIQIFENTFVIDLITEDGKCKGVLICNYDGSDMRLMLSDIIICATGGYGQLYSNTTNPEVATGDGISMAYRAGAELTDLEFIQFHPTVLYHPENKSFLISEAVRGEGAQIKNILGERFMPGYHELAELAPRDVVSRSIFMEMQKTGTSNVYLDITFKEKEYLENRFPNIYKTCLGYGIDISKTMIPIAPAEHYCMGGIKADPQGKTNIEGLFACGECASNGIHGANRLASNSLLEGLVFGRIIALQVDELLKDSLKSKAEKVAEALREIENDCSSSSDSKCSSSSDSNCSSLSDNLCDSSDEAHCGCDCDSNQGCGGNNESAGRNGDGNGNDNDNDNGNDGDQELEDLFGDLFNDAALSDLEVKIIKSDIQREMTKNVGIVRNKEGLEKALEKINGHIKKL
ncbi:MAG: L-aspartate oxidase, partial [Clostridiales bacterium]|nr:L-aspartate oxidase [Clostridiales bacterium]